MAQLEQRLQSVPIVRHGGKEVENMKTDNQSLKEAGWNESERIARVRYRGKEH